MNSETTMIAERCRIQEWAAQIRDCQNRPAGANLLLSYRFAPVLYALLGKIVWGDNFRSRWL